MSRFVKRRTVRASDLVKRESRHRWYVCPKCSTAIDLGPEPPLHSKAPRCGQCGSFGAPCTPDQDPRANLPS